MVKKNETPLSEQAERLKQRISQTFELYNLGDLEGLPERLKSMGHQSTAEALESLIDADINEPTQVQKEKQADDCSAFPAYKAPVN